MMLEISYAIVYALLLIIIYVGFNKVTKKSDYSIPIYTFAGVNIIWLIYLYSLTFSNLLTIRSLPPRFPLLVFVPIIIVFILLLKKIAKTDIYELVPKSWPIYYQTFRVIMEQIILATAIQDIIPMEATYKGYNYEFYFALTAPFIAVFAFRKKLIPDILVIAWNILGILLLLVVVTIIASAFFAPQLWGYQNEVVRDVFVTMPLMLLPAFMVPSAIFMHLFSIIQLIKAKE